MSRTVLGYALVTLAALCWATIGVFYTVAVKRFGLHPLTVVTYRALLAGIILGLFLLPQRGHALTLRRQHWGLFLAYIVLGIVAFYAAYVYAVALVGVAVAAVLLYTAPAWVAIIARLFLGERLHSRVAVALILTWVGVVLVAQAYDPERLRLNGVGLLAGLASGLTYGLYSVFQKVAVREYRPWTVQWYGLFWGGLLLGTLRPWEEIIAPLYRPEVWIWLVGLAIVPTLGGGLSYSIGVQWVPVSVASIVATLEPVAATFFGYVFLGERLHPAQWVGSGFIVLAVWLLRPKGDSEEAP